MSTLPLRPVSIKIEIEDQNRFKALAEARQRKPHYLMKEALRQYLDREEKRDAFHREALEGWQKYTETGLHLTGIEVGDWLDTWGTDKEAQIPDCHE
jgi:predicted transcriptional regulator